VINGGKDMTKATRVEYVAAGIELWDARGLVALLWLASDGRWSGAALRSKFNAPVRLAHVGR
jgi:hypothetical protein